MFVVQGLSPQTFQPWWELSDQALAQRGAERLAVREPGVTPCRISLEDAQVDEQVLLLPFAHQSADSPYRASGPIFVRRAATRPFHAVDALPAMLGPRLLSLRAYDRRDWIRAAEVVEGTEAQAAVERLLGDDKVRYLHVHFARPGCFAFRVDRN
jgi:hypothetical protein